MKLVKNRKAFAFIVPMTLAIVVGFAILAIGGYIVGEISSTLEDSFPAGGVDSNTTSWTRTSGQNDTISLLGNITDGFSDVVDIEIVVIIITALSMAIFAVMAVGSRRGFL